MLALLAQLPRVEASPCGAGLLSRLVLDAVSAELPGCLTAVAPADGGSEADDTVALSLLIGASAWLSSRLSRVAT